MQLINFKNISIKYKLMIIVMLITSIALLFACIIFVIYDINKFKTKTVEQLQTLAHVIGANNTAALTFMDADAALESLSSLKANNNIIAACIYFPDGRFFASYKNEKIKEEITCPLDPVEGVFFCNEHLEIVQKINFNNESVGLIYIKSSLTELYSDIKNFLKTAGIILLSSLLIAFIISSRIQRVISKPILRLAEIANEIKDKKDYSIRMYAKGQDEIGNLFHCFNDMLSQIEKQNEELVNAKKLAENSVKVKERFMANMSHEIRTPMNAIVGFTDLLLSANPTSEQKEFIEAIKISGKNLLVIINDILDFSKTQSGKMIFEQVEFNLSQLISTATELMLPKSIEKNIRLLAKIDKNIPDSLIGDPTRLNQILLNLLGNAIKFTEQGEVKIAAELLSHIGENVEIKFSVIDTGIGIAADKLSSIFEEFTQASDETTRKYGGTGLGLAIVKQLVELQGGKIFVKSIPWSGSEFSFELKFRKSNSICQNSEKACKEECDIKITRQLNILLVEDNLQNQLLAKKVLTKWNWNVEIAGNGTLAIEKLKQKDFDIILMDIQMPEMDGYEATHYIRKRMPLPKCNIPIMAMTAHAMSTEEEKARKASMNEYISKPFDQKVLYSKIISILNGKQDMVVPSNDNKNEMKISSMELTNGIPSPKHTDLSYLKEISNGDNHFIAEMISIFINETPEVLNDMKKYLQKRNWKSLYRVVHKMKPSVSFVGLKEIEETLKEVEGALQNETGYETISDKIFQVILICNEAVNELRLEIAQFK